VSSAIAGTMAAILGRARASHQPTRVAGARTHKLGLSKMRQQEGRHFDVKKMVMPKAEAPKQLSGYLGWSDKKKDSFSTTWNTTGANAAKSLYMHDLQDGHSGISEAKAGKQALVSSASVTSEYSRKLEDDIAGGDLPDIDWGVKAKAKQAPKIALKVQSSNTKSNAYLDKVGWEAPSRMVADKENPYLQTFREDPNKKFLAAAEAPEAKDKGKSNKYFDDLMPSAEYEVAMRT